MIGRYASGDIYVEFEGDLCRHPEGDEIENIRLRQLLILGHEMELTSFREGFQKSILELVENVVEWTND